jgi:hypothetical protein
LIFLRIPTNPPYLRKPKPIINDLGLAKKDYYTTKDVCKVLNLKPATFRYRMKAGKYSEPARSGGKRRFTEEEIGEIAKISPNYRKS